jgi:hypothetical protein
VGEVLCVLWGAVAGGRDDGYMDHRNVGRARAVVAGCVGRGVGEGSWRGEEEGRSWDGLGP